MSKLISLLPGPAQYKLGQLVGRWQGTAYKRSVAYWRGRLGW